MGPCKFWDQSRLCHDWLKHLFSANHIAVDGLRQIQNGDLDKNFTRADEDINLLLHVVLDYIKKVGEGAGWITVKSKCEDLTKKFPEKYNEKDKFPRGSDAPSFNEERIQNKFRLKRIKWMAK